MASLEAHVGNIAQQASMRLSKIWDEMGLDESERRGRAAEAFRAVEEAFSQLIASETSRRDTMQAAVHEHVSAIAQIASELGEPMVVVVLSPASGYQLTPGLARLSLQRQHEALSRRLDDLERMRFERIETMTRALSRIEALEALISLEDDTEPHAHAHAPQLSTQQLERLQGRLDALEKEHMRRAGEAREHMAAVVALWRELGEGAVSPFERTVLRAAEEGEAGARRSLPLSDGNMASLKQLRSSLEGERRARQGTLSQMVARIQTLWERLDVTVTEREGFARRNAGLSRNAMEAHRSELARLEGLKAANVAKFVSIAREDLRRAWSRCFVSEEQRALFPAFDADCPMDDDERLRALEEETERLVAHRQEHEELYAAIERRMLLWAELERMEVESTDPTRLSNRGGMLLKEEKLRNSIVRELPRLRDRIAALIAHFEGSTGRYFLINGERYLHVMDDEEEEHRKFKEDNKRQRQRAREDNVSESAASAPPLTPGKKAAQTPVGKYKTMPTTPASARKGPSAHGVAASAIPTPARKPSALQPSASARSAAAPTTPSKGPGQQQPTTPGVVTAQSRVPVARRILGEVAPQQQLAVAPTPTKPAHAPPSYAPQQRATAPSAADFDFAAFAENAGTDDLCSYDDFEFELNQSNMKYHRSSEMPPAYGGYGHC